ncbi:autotransporter outer membrane beta-barrel domain-containing protein [Salmonella enterica subsp. enterica serovar Enteritidis]|uniref:Autotransporter outer membrane beta-barrel domain-containing protein n=1 Tax=Salmonella enteritidis TaxID=149539 RepID=A0A702C4T3_SALEN|nr:fibronectin-binding autotransporter adhesin ShdA [Salmonella enterica subsp. enterica serovar Enteritidis]EAW2539462.1 autotransporter outer membrane beta-barrel domain-containing protein [Salmonella enterica]EDU9227818.1 autotransporter outer membrane beta-barrel domain-containing protein [Salmonella enterica subsp. enterica]EBB1924340.1 autotransporter outer membrane beta-barrel domain-containing protein [Salmonella enterica]EBQ9846320.1 fibronectin-binding autotransporter adhesin ShdA [Sa
MNRTYSIVWSAVRNMYVVASELARGHSKVKAQVCASEIHSPNQKSEYGQIIKATRAALACAVAAALGFFSPLAMADNQVSYADAQTHVLDASTPPMSYSGTDEGAALYVSGVATVGWQPTTVTGTGLVIETSGGGADDPDGGKYVSNAISLDHYAILELTDAKITTTGIYTQGISAADGSTLTLTDSTLTIDGNFGVMTLYTGSEATLDGTIVEAANSSSAQVQQGSTLNVLDGSTITLAQGQINVVAGNTATDEGSTLNLSDSSVSSAGTMSTIQGTNKAALNLTNATITHTNASGAAVQANNATTLDITGGNITSAGTGVYILASDARIDGATINADGDGIFITSKRKLDGYEDLNALTVNKAQVNSDTIALHVDTGTTINAPIVLTDSTFEAPEVIKLGSKAVIQANNTTLIGDVAQSDMSSSSLSLSQGATLTGSVDAMFTTLSLDDTSQWNMTDPSTVGNLTNDGDITLGNASGSTGTLLTVDNTLTLQDNSQINATLDTANSAPIIKAANVTLDGTLNLSSTATFVAPETDEHFGSITLIDSQSAITTDFDSVTLDADTSAMPDYLTINAGVDANDNTNYELSTGLSWYAGANSARAAHGTFTVDAGSTFTVTSELDETTATSNWNGSKLTKQGDGTLILSNTGNDYGDTEIDGGILAAKDAAALGTGDVTIAESATLALSQGTLDNNVTGEGQIVKSGSDELIVTGDNTYSGGTTISGGTLTADHADSLGTGAVANSGVLQVGEGELENTLSGSGSLVKTGTGELTLSGDNTYSGGTTITGGTLTADHADSLGSGDIDNSGGTTINEGTLVAASTTALGTGLVDNNATLVLDVDGEVSAVGGITTHSGATTQLALGTSLDLGDSALIQQDGSTLNVELNSDSVQPLITGGSATLGGDLVVSDASLQARASDAEFQSFKLMDMDSDISGDFTSLTMNLTDQPDYLTVTGTINPADASEYLLTEGLSWNATATSATPAHGTFTLGAGDSFEVTSVLGDKTGNGDWDGKSLTKLGAGKLTLSGANTYTGDTNVQEGTLWLSGDGSIGEMGSQQAVNVASGATFGGSNGTTVNGKVTNEGTLVFGDSEETGAIFTLNGDLINMGTIASGSTSSTPGNTLYVDGNYTGNGGSLYLNTVLGDDDSATDKLVITGDASGTTDLYINGIGDGAQTTNGIEVVDVGGVSTSDAFELKNEVNASLYTYRLYWNESDNDWYLASKAQSDDDDSGGDDSDVTPSDGGDDGGNVTPPDDGGDGGDVAPQYRADIGAYMGNQWMARNLQMQTLYDREGSQYRNADGSVWARFKAGKAESEAVSGNIDMDSNYSQFQLGGDILAWGNGQQSVTVGVMASYINADTDSTGNRGADGSQFTSSGNVDGYNLGVYATWFADAQTHSGAYVDSWYQYGFYNNSVESGDAGSESYDSTANAVSLETGYRYDIALSNGNTVSLTPQAQVVWQNYSADSVKDNYGTRIDGQDGDSWTTRLGLRVDGKLYKGSRTVIQPFAEANWLHTSDDVSVSFDDATVKQDLPANRAELKVGLQADIDKQWSVRAQVAGQTGSNDFGDLNGSLNLRYNW